MLLHSSHSSRIDSKLNMMKLTCTFFAVAAMAAVASAGLVPAAPLLAAAPAAPLLAAAPAIPAPIVTARSSQVVARNYNTFAAAPAAIAAAPLAALPATLSAAAPLTFAAAAAPLPYTQLTYAAAPILP